MCQQLSKWLLFIVLSNSVSLFAISMVYNFRIAQVTSEPLFTQKQDKNNTVLALFFDQYRRKYNGICQNFVGGFGSYIYDRGSNYVRVDTAVSHIKEKERGVTTFTGSEMDDILFTFGHNYVLNPRSSITFSGLFGIPTHKLFRLQHVDFGYSQVGMGIQFDGIYNLEHKGSFIYGARYIYFFPRTALDVVGKWHIFTIDNLADIIVAYSKNGLEFGYTSKFRFGAYISPNYDDAVQKTNYIRSSFYLVYKYIFSVHEIDNRLLLYISYGFDHKPKNYGNKSIITLWGSWSIDF